MEHVSVPGTVSGRLRSSALHMRSVRKDDMIYQRPLRDGLLKARGTSTFAIVNPNCPIRCDKVTLEIICMYAGFSNCVKICDIDYEIPFFHVYFCHLCNFEWLYTGYFLTFY